jgi:membrane fusion protein (multidrug efflux system)
MHFILRIFMCGLLVLFFSVISAMSQDGLVFDGFIEPSEVVDVSSQAAGILEQVMVERGERIKKGQVIAKLNSDIEEAALELATARVEFAKRKVLRNEDLYQKQLVSIHDKDEMETELRILELQMREAQEKLEIRTICSTVDGVVVERYLSPGEYVGEDPIMRTARIDPLYVEVIVPAEKFGMIKKNDRAEVSLDVPKQLEYNASVVIVDRVIDAASGTFGVRLILPNPDYLLPAGLKCKVKFPVN